MDEVLTAQVKREFRESFDKEYLALKRQLEAVNKDVEKNIQEAVNAANVKAKTEAAKEAREFYEQTVSALKEVIAKNTEENKELYGKLQVAELARIEAAKIAEKKISDEMDRIYKDAKAKADEENRVKFEEYELQLKQTKDALSKAKETAERGSQQRQGEALEQLVEKDLKDECRFDKIETVKAGARGADIKQNVYNNRGDCCGLILWEIKNTKWQELWIEKFKEDMAAEKASIGVIVVQDLPEKFGKLGCMDDRVFAIEPHMVKVLAVLLRSKIVEVYEIGSSQNFSSQNIEALYNYLTSGDFKARLASINKTYEKLRDLHTKDKAATLKRWGEYEKQLERMQKSAYTFVGELQGISNGEIGDIPLLDEGADESPEETA